MQPRWRRQESRHATPNDPCEQYSHTPDGYTADLHRCGFASLKDDAAMLETGQRLCAQMRSLNAHGEDIAKITPAIVDATGWSHDTAVKYAAITMMDLCPGPPVTYSRCFAVNQGGDITHQHIEMRLGQLLHRQAVLVCGAAR